MASRIHILFAACLMAAALFIGVDLCKCDVYAEGSIFTVSEYEVDPAGQYFALDFQENVTVTKVTSSNTKVVSIDDDYYYEDEDEDEDEIEYGSYVYLYAEGVGTAIITATDSDGNTDTCKVTVKPEPLVLSDTEITLDSYESAKEVSVFSESNRIKSVVSSNNTVVKGTLPEYHEVGIVPIGAGSAVITITDIYNQTEDVSIEITQKYIDEKNYLPTMKSACEDLRFNYRCRALVFEEDTSSKIENINIQVQIGSNSYTAKYYGYIDGYYRSAIRNLPVLPVGTSINCTLTKGEAVYQYKTTVNPGNLYSDGYMWLGNGEVYSFVYSGKKRTPAVHLEYWYSILDANGEEEGDEIVLKKGTDYKVTYTNSLNVGTAKVTATGIGNYNKSISRTFKIIPKGTSLAKLTAQKKAFTVKWNKQATKMSKSRITGYQIRYSTKSSMSGAKTVKVKGYANTSKKISKLKKKTKYYVQIRTYKIVSSKTYYSKWSAKKSIKTK